MLGWGEALREGLLRAFPHLPHVPPSQGVDGEPRTLFQRNESGDWKSKVSTACQVGQELAGRVTRACLMGGECNSH